MIVKNNIRNQLKKDPEAANPPQNLLKISREWIKYLIIEKDEELLGQVMEAKEEGDPGEPETIRFMIND